MNAKEHKTCYGAMMPGILDHPVDTPARGKIFSYELRTAGGMYRGQRRTGLDPAEWDECVQRPEFDACLKLGMAKLALESAVSHLWPGVAHISAKVVSGSQEWAAKQPDDAY